MAIQSIADIAAAWRRHNTHMARLRARPYVLEPALHDYLTAFTKLSGAADPQERSNAFRAAPSLEYYMERIDRGFSPEQRTSLAQRARASKPRIKLRGQAQMAQVIAEFASNPENTRTLAKQLFIAFYDYLRILGFDPLLNREEDVIAYSDAAGSKRTLSQKRFANILSSLRKSQKSH